ncbi:probable ankyrin repeat protein L59 at C-terminar half [Coccomyxa sp. Obi]|nr:probable ankyrin repeat protein L59 at C-terminar half [Coccomyxa sp. Obi]
MKPCYYYGEELLVLAEIVKEGGKWWQSCKARISQGTPPSITLISKKVAARAGWCALSDGEALHQEAPVILRCKLRVGPCELNADVHVVDDENSSQQSVPFDWHIHLGEPIVKALTCTSWDADVCYLDGLCKEGLTDPLRDDPTCCTSFTDALDSGHSDCMRYWHGTPIFSPADRICQGDNMRSWLLKQEFQTCEQQSNCEEAAQQPSAEALMYVHDVLGMSWDNITCAHAASAGSINSLSYAHCSGCPWEWIVCSSAVRAGSMACLMYAHEHGCEWDRNTCAAAASKGSMTFLKYAHEHGCEWDSSTCAAAAEHGLLDCLVYARKHGCPWNEWTCRRAAGSGNLEILAYLHENGCPWDVSTCLVAAYVCSMECLVYAHEQGCPWDDTVCSAAAQGGSLQCLRYAHEHGCPWSESTLLAAAKAGDLECLMYAHKHGCHYDPAASRDSSRRYMDGLAFAALQRVISLPCLKYVHESMGCMWDPMGSEWMDAFRWGRCDVLKYIHRHGGCFSSWKTRDLLYVEESLKHGDSDELLDGKARCVMYMHRFGGYKLPPLKGTKVGERMAIMRQRTAAVLLSFRVAGRARAGNCSNHAAHAAMAMVPADIIKKILCAANLNAD